MKVEYKKLLLLNIIFIAAVSFFVYEAIQKPDVRPVVLPAPEDIYRGEVSTSTPVRIIIPEAEIDGNVIPVGRAASGNMAVPEKFSDVGWYRYGPVPGQAGNAVLAGHVDNGYGQAGTFYNLKDVKIGDSVYIENTNAEKIKFVVREIRLIDYSNPSKEDLEAVFGKTDKERLNLITCEGTWIPEKETYSDRLVVFAERVTD